MARRRIPQVKTNVLDRAIAAVDPVRAARRYQARQFLALTGGYTGARRDRRQTQNWTPGAGSADADLLPDLPTLRERSRDAARNQPLAGGAISTVTTSVVGTGMRVQSTIDRDVLGLSDEAAGDWERAAEREFALWASQADITGVQTFAGLQSLAFRATLESGDVFALRRYKKRPGERYGLHVQLIEGDRVCNRDFQSDSTTMAGGITVDSDGWPQTVHVLKGHPGAYSAAGREWQDISVRSRDGESLVLHLFERLRPGQTRGVPYLAPVLEPLRQLAEYTDAELQAAVISSLFTVFIKSQGGEGLAPATDAGGAGVNSDGDVQLGAGAILDLAPGEEPEFANPARPNAQFDPFFVSIVRQIGVALELPFELMIKHFESSYSASRAALEQAWQFFRKRRAWLVENFCAPVYGWVIAEAVARGHLEAPGFFEDPMIRAAWLGNRWIGDARIQLDPLKEAKADQTYLDMGADTLSDITARRSGGDWEAIHRQRVKETTARRDAGLGETGAAVSAPFDSDQEEDDDENL